MLVVDAGLSCIPMVRVPAFEKPALGQSAELVIPLYLDVLAILSSIVY